MADVKIVGAGHPGDPFQVQILLQEGDLEQCRAQRGLVLDVTATGYEADPQIRTVIVQIAAPDHG